MAHRFNHFVRLWDPAIKQYLLWEVNAGEHKILQRPDDLLTASELQMTLKKDQAVEHYITDNLGFPFYKMVRLTKFVFGNSPICQYYARKPEDTEAILSCEALATTSNMKGEPRCETHRKI